MILYLNIFIIGPSGNQISGDRIEAVHSFISMLNTTVSHYSRKRCPNRRYMPSECSVSGLFMAYIEWHLVEHSDKTPVLEHKFRDIFTNMYNIVPGIPKTDVCDTCAQLKSEIQVEDETEELKKQLKDHTNLAEEQLNMLRKHRREKFIGDWRTVCCDLQQTLMCPKVNTQSAYYKRCMSIHNSNVHCLATQISHCYVWQETQAERGSSEIGSCLYRFVVDNRDQGFSKLRVIMDNCAGQNKNIYMVIMFLRMIQDRMLEEVHLEFLVSGHSFMPCDQTFGAIEGKLKRLELINTPDEYIDTIGSICNVQVQKMDKTHFYDLKACMDMITERKPKQPVLFSKATRIIMKSSRPWEYKIESPLGSQWVNLEKKARVPPPKGKASIRTPLLTSRDLPLKYGEFPLQIPRAKIADLRHLANFLSQAGRVWIEDLVREQTSAVPRPRDIDNREITHDDNMQDDDDVFFESPERI